MKKALILNTSHNDMRLLQALKELGYYVIATGNRAGLIGDRYADLRILLDYSDKNAVLEIAKQHDIDAICACCNDFGVLTASYVAEKLDLPGHDSYSVASILHRKDLFKRFAREHDIRTPLAEEFHTEEDALEWIETTAHYPLMVKAADLSAGNGILRASNRNEALRAVAAAFSASRSQSIVIEPYVEGSQHAICTFLIDKKVAAVASNNEFSFVNPYRVEIDTFPAHGISRVQSDLVHQIEAMAELLDLKDGIFEMQYILDAEGTPWILECMRRVLGNLYSIPASNYSGFNWDYWQVRAYCGLDMLAFPRDLEPSGFYAYRALMASKNGVFAGIEMGEELRPFLTEELLLQQSGYEIERHASDPMGFLFFSFPDAETMQRRMVDGYTDIRVLTREVSHA